MTDDARTIFEFYIALSFAGEDRAYVADVAERLRSQASTSSTIGMSKLRFGARISMIVSTTFTDVPLGIASYSYLSTMPTKYGQNVNARALKLGR